MRKTLWISVFVGVVFFGISAMADDFTFSFTNNVGTVSGTVTGEIIGLTNNATGAASQVIITSVPSGLSPFEGTPFDATTWDTQTTNSFTETNGVITAANFNPSDVAGACATAAGGACSLYLFLNGGGNNGDLGFAPRSAVESNDGVQYSPAVSAVPEPSSAILMSSALLTIVSAGRKRIRRTF